MQELMFIAAVVSVGLAATTTTLRTTTPSKGWTAEDYPWLGSVACKTGQGIQVKYVCDPDGVFLPAEHVMLDQLVADTIGENCPCSNATTCPVKYQGYHGAIAIAKRISSETTSESFAFALRTRWNLGACGNDYLLVLQAERDKITSSGGKVTEKRLGAACRDSINSHNEDSGERMALERTLQDYRKVLVDGNLAPCYYPLAGLAVWLIAVIAVAAILFLAFVLCVCAVCCCGVALPCCICAAANN